MSKEHINGKEGCGMIRIDAAKLIFTVINLLVLVVAMRIFLFKPVQNIIAKRQEEADKQLLEAAQKQEAAAVLEQKYSDTLNNIEEEKKKALSEARKDADTAYQKIIDDANKKADKIKEDAVIEAENTKTQIIKKAEKEIADMVVSAATKVVAGTDNVSADNSLYDEFLNKAGEE